jgi:RimJ/RimL family protein N-acetyltransferase
MRKPGDTLQTARLQLRRFTLEDLDLLDRLHGDPQVMQYTGGVKTRAQTEAVLRERILDYYEAHPGLGIWATIERAGGRCVGMHLLNHIRGEAHIQLGYMLFRDCWARGYATEMGRALLRYGYADLGLERIAGITALANTASQRVLEKAGLTRNGERLFAAYGDEPLAWFERDGSDWLAENPRDS